MAVFACVRATHFGTPFTRFVAPQGASQKAPVVVFACVRATHFSTPLTRFVAPLGAPPKAPVAMFACVPASHRPPVLGHPHEDRGPIGSSTEGPSGYVRMRPRPSETTILAHPSRGSWPHRATEGPNGGVHMRSGLS